MFYDIFISIAVVLWIFSGIVGFALLFPISQRAEAPAIVFYLFFLYGFCMMGPILLVIWFIKKMLTKEEIEYDY